jgi:ligand-binding sensor domain-containing protein
MRAYAAPDGLPEDIVRAVEVDRHGGVWAGTQQGLARLEGERFVHVPELGLSPVVWELFEDRDGSLWVGTNAALHQFCEQIFSVFGSSEGYPSDQPSVVYQHPDGALWIGFRDRGVMRRQNGVTTRFTQQDGLPANEVFSIRGAADGSVLVGTRRRPIRWPAPPFTTRSRTARGASGSAPTMASSGSTATGRNA